MEHLCTETVQGYNILLVANEMIYTIDILSFRDLDKLKLLEVLL